MNYFIEIKSEPASGIEIINLFSYHSSSESNSEYIRIKDADTFKVLLNIRLKTEYGSVFKQAILLGNLVLVGYGERFALYDYINRKLITELIFPGYFGSFKVDSNEIFVASESDLICLSLNGTIKWTSKNLGIDGVLIEKITNNHIEGSGEFDPPGGWVPFVIDRIMGKQIR